MSKWLIVGFLGILFTTTVVLANWAVQHYGIVSVGFGLYAPAGVFFAGLAFTFRDLLHEAGGRLSVIVAILVGALLSLLIEDVARIAAASAVAFLLSETVDLLVYTPLRRKNWLAAVATSNTAGLVLDSAVFLWLAFGSLNFIEGQVVAKAYMTIAAVVLLGAARVVLSRYASPRLAEVG